MNVDNYWVHQNEKILYLLQKLCENKMIFLVFSTDTDASKEKILKTHDSF